MARQAAPESIVKMCLMVSSPATGIPYLQPTNLWDQYQHLHDALTIVELTWPKNFYFLISSFRIKYIHLLKSIVTAPCTEPSLIMIWLTSNGTGPRTGNKDAFLVRPVTDCLGTLQTGKRPGVTNELTYGYGIQKANNVWPKTGNWELKSSSRTLDTAASFDKCSRHYCPCETEVFIKSAFRSTELSRYQAWTQSACYAPKLGPAYRSFNKLRSRKCSLKMSWS